MSAVELAGVTRLMSRRLLSSDARMWVKSVKSELGALSVRGHEDVVSEATWLICGIYERWGFCAV
jgi:hypothetical protein